MRKIFLSLAILLGITSGAAASAKLADYYAELGSALPTVEERAPAALECGIVARAADYTGTAQQNTLLEACLRGSELVGGTVTKPYTFSPNTIIRSSEVNAVLDTLYTLVNGNIDNNNIASGAAIDRTKVSGTAIVSTGQTSQTIGSTTTINSSLFVSSTTGVFRVPVMTAAQRDALVSPEAGSIIYVSDAGQFYAREGGAWAAISPAGETALASSTTKGIVEEATQDEFIDGTDTGGTGARMYVPPSLLVLHKAEHWNRSIPRGETTLDGQVLYITTTSSYRVAHGNVQGEVDAVAALAYGNGLTGEYKPVLLPGSIFYNASGLTTGSPVYLGNDGLASSSPGSIRKVIGYAIASTTYVFNPDIDTPTPTATANKIPIADSSGKLDTWITGQIRNFTAGETIDASSVPQAVYLKESDGRVYKLNATSAGEAAFAFVGFATVQSSVGAGDSIKVQTSGVVSGFSGLTVGGYYYGTNSAGTVSTTAGTISLQVGRAETSSTLFIQVGKKITSGTTSFTGTSTSTITVGFKPTKVTIYAMATGSDMRSMGGWTVNGGNNSVYVNTGSPPASGTSANAWFIQDGVTNHTGNVVNVSSTGFSLANTETGSLANVDLFYEVEG